MQASRLVKATEFLSAELFGPTGIMICPPKESDSPILFLARRRAWVLGAGAFLFSASDTGPKGVDEIDHLWRRTFFARLDRSHIDPRIDQTGERLHQRQQAMQSTSKPTSVVTNKGARRTQQPYQNANC